MPTKVIDWNGRELPAGLRELPPGRYVVEPLDELLPLTPEEDAGLRAALDGLDAGGGSDLDDALRRIESRLPKR